MNTMPQTDRCDPLLRSETPSRSAKAHLRKPETEAYRVKVGAAIERARTLRGWTLDELSGQVDRDPRQVARWISGAERPHMDALFAIEGFRKPLVIALAELVGPGVEIDTVIRLRILEARA